MRYKIKLPDPATVSRYLPYLMLLLAGLALFLGIAIYKTVASKAPRGIKLATPASTAPSGAANAVPGAAEKQQLLKIRQDSSQEEKQRHFDLVQKFAQDVAYLDITGCAPRPFIIRLKDGKEFGVKNADGAEREMGIDPQHIYTIPARSEKKIKADFGHGPGVYGYGCDKSQDAVGMLLIIP